MVRKDDPLGWLIVGSSATSVLFTSYLLIATIKYQRETRKSCRILYGLYGSSLVFGAILISYPWVSCKFIYTTTETYLGWWLYRFVLQVHYYSRFKVTNVDPIRMPQFERFLFVLLGFPVFGAVMGQFCMQCDDVCCHSEGCAYVIWSTAGIVFVEVVYLAGFILLLRRFDELGRSLGDPGTSKTRSLMGRNTTIFVVTNLITFITNFVWAESSRLGWATDMVDLTVVNFCILMTWADWRQRMCPWVYLEDGGRSPTRRQKLKEPLLIGQAEGSDGKRRVASFQIDSPEATPPAEAGCPSRGLAETMSSGNFLTTPVARGGGGRGAKISEEAGQDSPS